MARVVTAAELAEHTTSTDCWLAVDGNVYDDDYDDAEFRALGQFPALPQKTLPPQRQDDYDDAQFRALGQFPALPQKTLPPQRQAIALAPRAA
jgi:hypothetical protein